MTTRFDLISPRPKKGNEVYWHKVGAAFPRDKGGFSLVFDSLPIPDKEGRVTVLMSEARAPNRPENKAQYAEHDPAPQEDTIPF